MKDDDSSDRLPGCRVLIIEDESLVAMLIEDTLVGMGCEVTGIASKFSDAEQKARSESLDVAILDVNLSGTQTLPIAEILFSRGIPFVFATGYGVDFLPAHLEDVPVLQKPFEKRELKRALCLALDKKS